MTEKAKWFLTILATLAAPIWALPVLVYALFIEAAQDLHKILWEDD